MNARQIGNLRVIDLTKVLGPKTESRRCDLTRFNIGGPVPDSCTIVDLTSHLGTHVERPYHHSDSWSDMESLPITTFMGRATYVSIGGCEPNHKITGGDSEEACGGRAKGGDTVIIDSPMKLAPFIPDSDTGKDKRLFICHEIAERFRGKKVECVSFGDGVSIESSNEDICTFHDILVGVNCVFLEVLRNLRELTADTLFMSYSPLSIKGLDSYLTRVYAIEGLVEFSR